MTRSDDNDLFLTHFHGSTMVTVSYKFSRSSSVVTSLLTSKMRNLFGCLFRLSESARDIIATKDETELASLPPPYEELPPLRPSPEIPTSAVHALKRCLIWRMAIDLGLKRYVPRIERPNDYEYSRFETCCEDYCKILGEHPFSQESLDDSNEMLWYFVFRPGSELGIPCGEYLPILRFPSLLYIVSACSN